MATVEAICDAGGALKLGKKILLYKYRVTLRRIRKQSLREQFRRAQCVIQSFSGNGVNESCGIASHRPTVSAECRVLQRLHCVRRKDVGLESRVFESQPEFRQQIFEPPPQFGGALAFHTAADSCRKVIGAGQYPDVAVAALQEFDFGNPASS